jgi:hypothetical protein
MTKQEQLAVETRKAAAMESIAESIQAVADAILQHATVQKQDVAYALGNIAAAITSS